MKQILILCLALLISVGSFAQEEEKLDQVNHFFHHGLFNTFASQMLVGYELQLKNHNSFLLNLGVAFNNQEDNLRVINTELYYNIDVWNSDMIKRKRHRDGYFSLLVSPYVGYQYYQDERSYTYFDTQQQLHVTDSDKRQIYSGQGGVLFGARAVFFDRLSFLVNFGGAMKGSDQEDTRRTFNPYAGGTTGIIPKGNFLIGVRF